MSRAVPTDHEVLLERAGFDPYKRKPAPVTTFRVCGGCPSRKDPLSCQRAACPTRTVSLKAVERANDMLVAHAFPWCRARLLHALGAAEEQGVLADVLAEILGDSAEAEHVRAHLRRHGWSK